MGEAIDSIKQRVHDRGFAEVTDVREVERIAERDPSAELHLLIGDLIQLLDEPGNYRLEDAERAYLSALKISPKEASVLISLGNFYDAVMDDPTRAKPFFEAAVDLGSSEAEERLQDVVVQLSDG